MVLETHSDFGNESVEKESAEESLGSPGVETVDACAKELPMTAQAVSQDDEKTHDPIALIIDTPVLRKFKKRVERVVGAKMDVVTLAIVMMIIAAKLRIGFNLCVVSSASACDALIRNALLEIVPSSVRKVATPHESRKIMHEGYLGCEIVNIVSGKEGTFDDACKHASSMNKSEGRPSIICINDEHPGQSSDTPTVVLSSKLEQRELRGLAESSVGPASSQRAKSLRMLRYLFRSMGHRRAVRLGQFKKIAAQLEAYEKLVFVCVLCAFAALRRELEIQEREVDHGTVNQVNQEDYRRTWLFLTNLPIPTKQSRLSPQAAETGRLLHEAAQDKGFGQSIADHSELGSKNFTRRAALGITGDSYNTIKAHLQELVDAGILEEIRTKSTSGQDRIKRQGCQIFYRFESDAGRNLDPVSPFAVLPRPGEIAANCSDALQP